jgi:nitrogenase molybdenum-iron protein alpha/beta subunit
MQFHRLVKLVSERLQCSYTALVREKDIENVNQSKIKLIRCIDSFGEIYYLNIDFINMIEFLSKEEQEEFTAKLNKAKEDQSNGKK